MKDSASHRKRNKSEGDPHRSPDRKDSRHGESGKTGQHKGERGQHRADHGHHKTDGHQKAEHGHHKAEHGHHKSEHGHHKGDHLSHGDHGHHDGDHHHSASSHAYRPRRDTMLSRGGYSTHHESDRRSTGTNEGGSVAPMVYYENTYKLTPDDTFHGGKVKEIIKTVLQENITEKLYDPNTCGAKCKLISEIIKERVKKLSLSRFKIVCTVTIGQVFDQSMLVTSRCLWNHKFDNSVSVEFRKGNIIAVGVVFALYVE